MENPKNLKKFEQKILELSNTKNILELCNEWVMCCNLPKFNLIQTKCLCNRIIKDIYYYVNMITGECITVGKFCSGIIEQGESFISENNNDNDNKKINTNKNKHKKIIVNKNSLDNFLELYKLSKKILFDFFINFSEQELLFFKDTLINKYNDYLNDYICIIDLIEEVIVEKKEIYLKLEEKRLNELEVKQIKKDLQEKRLKELEEKRLNKQKELEEKKKKKDLQEKRLIELKELEEKKLKELEEKKIKDLEDRYDNEIIQKINNKEKFYLNILYKDKNYIKDLGGIWDPLIKKWFCYYDNIILIFKFANDELKNKYKIKKDYIYFRIPFNLSSEFNDYRFNRMVYNNYYTFDKIFKLYYISYNEYKSLENELLDKYKYYSLYIN